MKLASKGLGKIILPFRFTEARISEAADCLVLEGIIKEKKVNWTYRAELEDSDIINFVILARNPVIVSYIADRVGLALFGRLLRSAVTLVLGVFRRAPADSMVPHSRGIDVARGEPGARIEAGGS
jgi:hypothetical protein